MSDAGQPGGATPKKYTDAELENLSRDEQDTVMQIVGPRLVRLGYEP